jgi:hypothetical protein
MGLELLSIERQEYTKGSGKTIHGMDKEWKDTQMVTDMRASSKEANLMAKEFIAGQTVKSTKENG